MTAGALTRRTSGKRQVALPVSRGGFFRRHSTFSSRPSRTWPRAKRFLAKSVGRCEPSRAARHQHRRSSAYPPRLCGSKPKALWMKTVGTDRCRTSITSWNRTTGRSSDGYNASQHFRSFWGAWRTIAGYEAIHMIRKGQACWSAAGGKVGLLHRYIIGMLKWKPNSYYYRSHLPFDSKVATLPSRPRNARLRRLLRCIPARRLRSLSFARFVAASILAACLHNHPFA